MSITTPEFILIEAVRRVVLARANPKLDWGQSKAMAEESFALDALGKALAGYDDSQAANCKPLVNSPTSKIKAIEVIKAVKATIPKNKPVVHI